MRIVNASAGVDTAVLKDFADWLLRIGDGASNDAFDRVVLPDFLCLPERAGNEADIDALCDWVYPELIVDDPGGVRFWGRRRDRLGSPVAAQFAGDLPGGR